MTNDNKGTAPKMIQEIQLPFTGVGYPGPLNTIVSDAAGNIYYSDEINHSIVSLDAKGKLRWHKAEHGNKSGAFHYPMGISVGWVQHGEKEVECVAVSDAWNHRVQLLDLSGNVMEIWDRAGELPFADITDVRFIPGDFNRGRGASSMSFWLVLDRGNHRLCAMTKDGELLFQVGHCFPNSMASRWTVPGIFAAREFEHEGKIKEFPPIDFAFYPQRILGDCENALYLWEAGSRLLKQVVFNCLLPMRFGCESGIEWITADERTLIGWRKEDKKILVFDSTGERMQELRISGVPICCHGLGSEIWVQMDDRICRLQLGSAAPEREIQLMGLHTPLLRTAREEIERVDLKAAASVIDEWTGICDRQLKISDQFLSAEMGDELTAIKREITSDIQSLNSEREQAQKKFAEMTHGLCLGTMECHLVGIENASARNMVAYVREHWCAMLSPAIQRFPLIQERISSIAGRRERLANSQERSEDHEPGMSISILLETELRDSLEWIYRSMGIVEGSETMRVLPWLPPLPEALIGKARAPGHVLSRRSLRGYSDIGSCLREIDRIPICGEDASPSKLGYCVTPQIGVESSNEAAADVAVDCQGRLWWIDPANKRICVEQLMPGIHKTMWMDRKTEGTYAPNSFGVLADRSLHLLRCDELRAIKISPDGVCEAISDHDKKTMLTLGRPWNFASLGSGRNWVVDRDGHRIIQLDKNGQWQIKGTCGIGVGQIYFPEAVAEFEDGLIAVAQNVWNRSIRILDQQGLQLGAMKLTYYTRVMMVAEKHLFVIDADNDVIRVYERLLN